MRGNHVHIFKSYNTHLPEEPEIDNLDKRCDVFGLGSIVCVILTGQPARTGKSRLEMLTKAMKGDLRDAQARLAACGADAELIDLAQKCLAAEKEQRPRDAGVVSQEVAAYQAGVQELLRAAELARAAAQTKALEERKRQKVVAGLALALLTVVVLVGGGAWYYQTQQQARANELARRRQETDQAVIPALAKAEQLSERATAMPLASSKEAEAALVVWQQASDALGQAETALRTGVPNDRLAQQVETQRGRIAEALTLVDQRRTQASRREKLFRDLDDARMARAVWVDKAFDNAGAVAKFAAAFTNYDLDVTRQDEFARRIDAADLELRDALIVALYEWALLAAQTRTTALVPTLNALAQGADHDAWRQRFRASMLSQDRAALRDLSVEPRLSSLPSSNLVLLAQGLDDRGDHKEALAVLRLGRGQQPTDFWLHFSLGFLLHVEKGGATPVEVEEAIGCYRAALALRPTASAAHNNLGTALNAKKQLDEAIAEYRQAIKLDPKLMYAHANLGAALASKNQLDEAISECRTAIDLNPSYAPAHNILGAALADKNQLDEAIAEYHKALDLDPKDEATHYNFANALADKQQWDEAAAEYRTAIQLRPHDAAAHYGLGRALGANKQWDAAIAAYQKVIELDRNHAKAHYGLAYTLAAKKQWDEAIPAYRTAIELNAKDPHAHTGLGIALVAKNQWDEAIAECRKALEINPKDALAHFNVGLALKAKNQLDLATAAFRQAIELDPKNAGAHFNLGLVLETKNELDEAIAELRQTIDLDPKYAGAHFVLGIALANKKRKLDEAIAGSSARPSNPSIPSDAIGPTLFSALPSWTRSSWTKPSLPSATRSNSIPKTHTPTTTWA